MVGLFAAFVPTMDAAAQHMVAGDRWDWTARWTPLRPIGNLGLPAPKGAELPRRRDDPASRIGLFWTAANPAGLLGDADSTWSETSFNARSLNGSYKRPLDAPQASDMGIGIGGWRAVGTRSVVIGRARLENEQVDRGSQSAFTDPYGSSPFAPSDTNAPAVVRPAIVIDAAQAVALKGWQLGVAAGYRALENNNAALSREGHLGRRTETGVTLGVARAFGVLSAGLHARALRDVEVITLVPNPGVVRVHALDGYLNVKPATYSPVTGEPFFRRSDRTGCALGVGLAGQTAGARWVVYGDGRTTDEHLIADISSNPPAAFWSTSGWAAGAAAERSWNGANVTIRVDYASQDGETENATNESALTRAAPYRANGSELSIVADVAFELPDSLWDLNARVSFDRLAHRATDEAARAFTDISALLPGAGLEISRVVSNRVSVSAGYALRQYTPFATLPAPLGRGKTYETLIAPAIEVAASTARAHRLEIGARLRIRSTLIDVSLWTAGLGPVGIRGPVPPTPTGNRSTRGINIGLRPLR